MGLDWTDLESIRITLTGNLDINDLDGGVEGKNYMLVLKQDGTGGRTLTISAADAAFSTDTPIGTFVLSTAANAIDLIALTFTLGKYRFMAINKGFA